MSASAAHSERLAFAAYTLAAVAAACTACAQDAAPRRAAVAVRHFDPEPIRITLDDLPEPYASNSARQPPRVVPPPDDAALEIPPGFAVNVFADNLPKARWLAITPDGDVLCAASRTNTVHLLRDTDGDGAADERHAFFDEALGADLPFGIAFLDGHCYIANTSEVLRFDYEPGQTRLRGEGERILDLPGRGYHQHWTRNIIVAPDGEHLFVSVGSRSNADPEPPPRASVVRMKPDGSDAQVFASGLRNPVGMDFHPATSELYVTVNERDGLGDDLVPDYFTRIREGEFYGWPYAYLTPENLDPRHTQRGRSARPDLAERTRTPDVLFQSHSAALGLAFYDGEQFPQRYRNGAFVAFRGSWNRSEGTGYKIVFVPFDDTGRPKGWYEDFVRGFLIEPSVPRTWGRPVGVAGAPDGSLLFTEEEAAGRVYRVTCADRSPDGEPDDATPTDASE